MITPLLLSTLVSVALSVLEPDPRAPIQDGVLAVFDGPGPQQGIIPAYYSDEFTLGFIHGEISPDAPVTVILPYAVGDYYIMRIGSGESFAQIPSNLEYVRLGQYAIFRAEPAIAAGLSRYGWGLTRLNPIPQPGERIQHDRPPATVQADSNILEMISIITPESSHQLITELSSFATRYSFSQGCRDAEQDVFNRFGELGLNATYFPFQFGGTNMRNVIGEKLGEVYPESVIIICGHLDCTSEIPEQLAPGAEDNGSGSAVVLEVARAISPFPCELTLRFVTFSGEEQGLIGSDYYAAYVDSQNENIVAVINADMVGYSGPYAQDMYIFSDGLSHSLGALGASIISEYTDLDTVPYYETFPRFGSDHYSFAIRGFPAIFFIDAWFDFDWYPYYHTVADTVGNLNMNQQAAIAQAVAAMAGTLARPDFSPRYVAGDVNGSGSVNGVDVVYLVSYLKGGPPPPDPILRADANGSCSVNGIDVVYLVSYLKGGPPPFYGDCR
jgi:hypothetical protein